MVTALVTIGVPALAEAVGNADKVDGFHAVGSNATTQARKGKLVATSPRTGRLPNNIISKAPDADKLDGFDSLAFLKVGDKAADSELLDGKEASEFTVDEEVPDLVEAADGAGSGLDADFLDGTNSAAFALDSEVLDTVKAGDGTGSLLDADFFDGLNSTVFALENEVMDIVRAADGTGSNLDADKLDGLSLDEVAPIVRASTDMTSGFITRNDTGDNLTNTVTLNAPTAGVFTISGSAYINNNETLAGILYALYPRINGSPVTPNTGEAVFQPGLSAGTPGNPAERFTLAYTLTVPVAAGNHTITQFIQAQNMNNNQIHPADYDYNRHNLTVTFFPSTRASVVNAPAG